MKLPTSLGVIVGLFLVVGLATSFPVRRSKTGRILEPSKSVFREFTDVNGARELKKHRGLGDDSWDYFLFVQTSPSGDCYFENYENCGYPANSTQWTMHGIWPTQNGTLGPNYCTKVTFYLDEVEDLIPQLISQWTNVKTDTSFASFWAHEYEKHGSCAVEINAMSNEHSFFSQTLSLHEKYDFTKLLESAGIEPSTTYNYHPDDFNKAFQNALGVTPLLECLYSKDMGQVLYQMSICLRKDFTVMPCEQYVFSASKTRCYDDETFLYIPKNTQ